jgi:Sulfotransferase domain
MPDGQAQAVAAFDYRAMHVRIEQVLAKDLFFIGAYPKSGTTWLVSTLNQHPEISCSGEGHFCNRFARLLESALKSHNTYIETKNRSTFGEFPPFPGFDQDQFRYLLASSIALVLSQTQGAQEAQVIGEKTPDNLGYFMHLALLFPQAKFLHVVRDARDCAVSAWFHNLRVNPDNLVKRFPTIESFAGHIATDWKNRIEHGLRFCAAYPSRCLIVHYERMFLQPRETLHAILRFLGVDADPAVVQQCISAASFQKMSGGRQPGAEDRASFLRQGKPGNWTQHFTPDMNRDFLTVAGPVMAHLGYRVSGD